jgi:hypothetical protein
VLALSLERCEGAKGLLSSLLPMGVFQTIGFYYLILRLNLFCSVYSVEGFSLPNIRINVFLYNLLHVPRHSSFALRHNFDGRDVLHVKTRRKW